MMTYPMHVAGLVRDLPICKVTEDFYIGAFIMFGDAELTVACARDLLKLAEELDYDYLLTAEAKSIPLIHEMARQSGAEKYFIARKGPKVYMPDPISVEDRSITTLGVQQLFLGRDDADLIKGKKILIVDDVISTGGSLHAILLSGRLCRGSDAAAVPAALGQQVGERNAVEIVIDERVELLPDGQRETLVRARAGVLPLQTGNGRKRALRQPDDLADRIILQLPAKAVAAALAALPLDQSRAREHGDDAL